MSVKWLVLHTVGLGSVLACVGFTVFAFLWMSVTGGKAFFWEPFLGVRYIELVLFSFSFIYGLYLLKFVWFGQLKKLAWEKQKERFYYE